MSSVGFAGSPRSAQIMMIGAVIDRVSLPNQAYFGQSLPTDPIGTCTRTFDGVPAGSEIRVYDPSRNELAGVETCAANHTLAWPVYAAGSPNNTVRIVIINFAYKIKEFAYTSSVGSSSIPIQAELDKWASNPA